MLDFIILFLSIFTIIFVELYGYNPPPLFGVYSRKNGFYWLKYYLIKTVLLLRKKITKKKSFENLEQAHKLPKFGKAVDEIFFNGANKNGDHIILAIARRPKRLVDGFLYLKIRNSKFGLLESPKLPSTNLYQENELEEFTAEGLTLTPIVPMKKWKICYEGPMKESGSNDVKYQIKIDGIWCSDLPHFDFNVDIEAECLAKAIAKEKWSADYFKNLEKNNHEHYEQYGNLTADIFVGNQRFNLNWDTIRAHSVAAHREWRFFKRYAEHWFSCENGDRYNVAIISMPISYSELTVGCVYSEKHQKLLPVTDCDFKLYQHGHLGSPPLEYGFSFTAGDEKYTVNINIEELTYFYTSKDWEVKIYEGFGKFTVNGRKGWGCAEWVYRNSYGTAIEDYRQL